MVVIYMDSRSNYDPNLSCYDTVLFSIIIEYSIIANQYMETIMKNSAYGDIPDVNRNRYIF